MDQIARSSISHDCTKSDCFYCQWQKYNEERLKNESEHKSGIPDIILPQRQDDLPEKMLFDRCKISA